MPTRNHEGPTQSDHMESGNVPAFQAALNELAGDLEHLHKTVFRVRERVNPALIPAEPDLADRGDEHPSRSSGEKHSPYVSQLRAASAEVNDVITQLNLIHDRLET
jgi:hypothetical protein